MSIHTEDCVNLYSQILPAIESEIEATLLNKKSLPVSHLAQTIHEKYNVEYVHARAMVAFYISRRADMKIRPGKSGGIVYCKM